MVAVRLLLKFNRNQVIQLTTQIIVIVITLLAFVGLGFMLSRSIKKHEAERSAQKKKKGRNKYMPQSKNPGGK